MAATWLQATRGPSQGTESLGYAVGTGEIGSVQAVVVDRKTGKQYGGADSRREGTVIGLPRPQGRK